MDVSTQIYFVLLYDVMMLTVNLCICRCRHAMKKLIGPLLGMYPMLIEYLSTPEEEEVVRLFEVS